MNLQLNGKVALVAAGTSGLGLAVARALVREGAIVSVCGMTESKIASLQNELGPKNLVMKADVRSKDDIAKWIATTAKKLGDPSILVTNTGGPAAGLVTALTEDQWIDGLKGTILNVKHMVDAALPYFQKHSFGRIVHISSLVAQKPADILAISSTLRAGLSVMTSLQAKQLGPFGITVNTVLPGHTMTDRQTHLLELKAKGSGRSIEEEKRIAESHIPLRRMAEPEEIANSVVFLCSSMGSYVTGTELLVDGGANL